MTAAGRALSLAWAIVGATGACVSSGGGPEGTADVPRFVWAPDAEPALDSGGESDALPLLDSDADLGTPLCLGDARPRREAIINGTAGPTLVPLAPGQSLALLRVARGPASCSGVLVAPRWVLTAGHCVADAAPDELSVRFGDGRSPALAVVAVASLAVHPDRDLALAYLAQVPDLGDLDPVPIPILDLPEPSWLGRAVEVAGFGMTAEDEYDGLTFAVERVVEESDDALVVDGEHHHGPCLGDSGGPALTIAADATLRVVGVLSEGDTSCVGRDRYARIDTASSWASERVGEVAAPPAPCGRYGEGGGCDGPLALICQENRLITDTCEADEVCGFSSAEQAFACIDPDEDPCAGLDGFGRCDGALATWCDGTALRQRDCASCDRVCAIVDGATGVDCVEPVCQGVDGAGECQDDVARYCLLGVLHEDDCAALDTTCAEGRCACGPYDAQGACQGDTRVACNGRFLEVEDCAAEGLACTDLGPPLGNRCR